MKRIIPLTIIWVMLATNLVAAQNTLSTSRIWYASVLQKYFPAGVKIRDIRYPLYTIPCLPQDITKFNIIAGRADIGLGPAFQVRGTVKLGAVPSPFAVKDAAYGKKYRLYLQAFLLSSDGRVIWEQAGFPEEPWVSVDGDMVGFFLINAFRGSTRGCKLLVIAAGEPIFSDHDETRVILGIKQISVFEKKTEGKIRYGLTEAQRKQAFYDLVRLRDSISDDDPQWQKKQQQAYAIIAEKYGVLGSVMRKIAWEASQKD